MTSDGQNVARVLRPPVPGSIQTANMSPWIFQQGHVATLEVPMKLVKFICRGELTTVYKMTPYQQLADRGVRFY